MFVKEDSPQEDEVKELFYPDYCGSKFYRIPALVKTEKGTLIAGADKRNTNQEDWGNIDSVIRRKPKDKTEFEEAIVVLDLAEAEESYAFLIDMSLLVVRQGKYKGRIYLLVDMNREGGNFWSALAGTGFETIDKKYYRLLLDKYGKRYTVREDGSVYDDANLKTAYKVKIEDKQPFKKHGDLSKDNKFLGNIYLERSPLKTYKTSYLWLTYSDDDGLSWQSPKDITPQVKAEWMRFIGVGPGRGLELKSGRLVYPIYYTDAKNNKQSSALIYSDDGGINWQRGVSPNDTKDFTSKTGQVKQELSESQVVELNNSVLLLFMRNYGDKVKYAISYDQGESFEDELEEVSFTSHAYCQLSVIHFNKDDKEYILLSNPAGPERTNGSVKLGLVHNERDIEFISEYPLNDKAFQYSCLCQLSEDKFAVLYEEDDKDGKIHIKYKDFSFDDLIKACP